MRKETEPASIEQIMYCLQCTREEAEDVLAYDKRIDKAGAKEILEYDLAPEVAKEATKMAHTGTRKTPTNFEFTKRERKANPTKGAIIAELAKFLAENSENAVENCEITNKERQIAFTIGEEKYELTLIQKRKPK